MESEKIYSVIYYMKHLKLILIVLAVMVLSWFNSNTVDGQTNISTSETTGKVIQQITKPEIKEVSAEKAQLIERVDILVENVSVSTAIVEACMKHTEDYKLCIKNIIWVSNAESGIFKKAMHPSNNWFGIMEGTRRWYEKKRFSSVEDSIYYWVNRYVTNEWYKRTTWQAWLNWKYCTSWCEHRIKLYNDGIRKLNID